MLCDVGDCPNPAARSGKCWGHWKALQRGDTSRRELVKRPGSPLERLTEAAITYAEADDDEDFERGQDNLRKSALAYSRKHASEAIRAAMARLKERGVRLGRPPKLDPEEAARLVQELGGVSKAARALHISRWTVWRALRGSTVGHGAKGQPSATSRMV